VVSRTPNYVTGGPEIYPRHEEVDFSDDQCPNCGHECFTCPCSDCGGDGCHDGYEEDPLLFDPGDVFECHMCRGEGHFCWCPRCGWDMNLPEKYNTPRHRGVELMKP